METLGSMDGVQWVSLKSNIDVREFSNAHIGVDTFNHVDPKDSPIMHVDYFRVNIDTPSGGSNVSGRSIALCLRHQPSTS